MGKRETRSAYGGKLNCQRQVPLTQSIRIRAYCPEDRAAIRRLCCDTGLLGNPVEGLFSDRELFADLFTGAYLKQEPEWALVAECKGRVVGYLLGSVQRHFDLMLMRNGLPIALKMIFRLLRGRYKRHSRSRDFIRWLLTVGYKEQPKHPANAAHLHLDLDNGYRGHGIARRLWQTYEQRLISAGVRCCYGAFFSHSGRRPETVYARYGFKVFDRKQTTMFQPELADVEIVCMHKKLRMAA